MKKLLLSLFILAAILGRASDTLTIREIYNFDVGDTFDYKSTFYSTYHYSIDYINYSYSRYTIAAKWFSPGHDTIYYQRSLLYPQTGTDTIQYFALDSGMVFIDTLSAFFMNSPDPVSVSDFSVDTMPHTTRIQNHLYCTSFENSIDVKSAAGVGQVQYQSWAGSPDEYSYSGKKLIFYHKANEVWGVPYNVVSGIYDLSNAPNITITPSPTSGWLRLTILPLPHLLTFTLTGICGQKVYEAPVSNGETTHDISTLPVGIYLWALEDNNGTIQTGKIVKQ